MFKDRMKNDHGETDMSPTAITCIGIFIGIVLMIPAVSFFSERASQKKESEMKLKQWREADEMLQKTEGKTIEEWIRDNDTRPKDWYKD